MAQARLFTFRDLPQLSRHEVALLESMGNYLSSKPLETGFAQALSDDLRPYLKTTLRFGDVDFRVIKSDELKHLFPSIGCWVVIAAAPSEHKILIELDTGVVAQCISRLLGGTGKEPRIRRPLTNIEEGVFSFVLLKVLAHFNQGWRTGRELTLTLDRFATTFEELQPYVAKPHYHVASIKLTTRERHGYARVLVPCQLVTEHFGGAVGQPAVTDQELTLMRRRLQALGTGRVMARVEIASLDLTQEDITGLDAGDIVIIENHQITKTDQGIEGEALIKLGAGTNGEVLTQIFYEGDTTKLRIVRIITHETPPEAQMENDEDQPQEDAPDPNPDTNDGGTNTQGDAPHHVAPIPQPTTLEPDDNFGETVDLLRDVPAPVVVELGRIQLNTNQIVRLREGQILRLPRGPHDPVQLVVNGKIFARGELVEVEGELGVRLQKIVTAS